MTQLGIGTYKEPLQENLDSALALFDVLELQDFVMPDNLENPGLLREYRGMLNGFGGEITIHGPYLNLVPTSLDKRVSAVAALRYMQAVDIASQMEANKVIIHSYYDPRPGFAGYENMWLEDNIAFWSAFLDKCRGSRVCILLENLHDPEPGVFTKLIAALDTPLFSTCLDIGHCHCFSRSRPEDWIALNPGSYYHITDNDGLNDLHLPIGRGTVNLAGIAARLSGRPKTCLISEASASWDVQLQALRHLKELMATPAKF